MGCCFTHKRQVKAIHGQKHAGYDVSQILKRKDMAQPRSVESCWKDRVAASRDSAWRARALGRQQFWDAAVASVVRISSISDYLPDNCSLVKAQ